MARKRAEPTGAGAQKGSTVSLFLFVQEAKERKSIERIFSFLPRPPASSLSLCFISLDLCCYGEIKPRADLSRDERYDFEAGAKARGECGDGGK